MGPRLYNLPVRKPLRCFGIKVAVGAIGCLLSFALTTQFVAHQLNYQEILGSPVAGKFYNPLEVIIWQLSFWDDRGIAPVLIIGWLLFIFCIFFTISALLLIHYRQRSWDKLSDLFGSAHFATEKEIRRGGLLEETPNSLYIGMLESPVTKKRRYLTYNGEKHLFVSGPTGKGKSSSVAIPNLLSWPHSVFVKDLKGELWNRTAGWRKANTDSLVIKFAPTCDDGTGACFNPLLEIRLGRKEVKDAQNIAHMLVDPDAKGLGDKDHWARACFTLFTGAMIHVLYREKNKTISGIIQLLTSKNLSKKQILRRMANACHDPERRMNWKDPETGEATTTHPTVASIAHELLMKEEAELSGIFSTALTLLSVYRDPVIAQNTSRSDFRILDLMHNDKNLSLYMIIPPSDIARMKPLERLMINLIATRLTERMESRDGRSVREYKHRLLLVLDEFPAMGRVESYQNAHAVMRGYGIQALIMVQDYGQLFDAYGKNESISSNCDVRIALTPNKLETASLISRLLGSMTIGRYSKSFAGKMNQVVLDSISEGKQEVQRKLLTPEEVMRTPDSDELVFVGSMFPIYAKKLKYYEDPRFIRRAQMAAPNCSDIVERPDSMAKFPDINKAESLEREQSSEQRSKKFDENKVVYLFPDEEEKERKVKTKKDKMRF